MQSSKFCKSVPATLGSRAPRALEMIGYLIGFIGASILVVPEQLEKLVCCCRKKKKTEEDNMEKYLDQIN